MPSAKQFRSGERGDHRDLLKEVKELITALATSEHLEDNFMRGTFMIERIHRHLIPKLDAYTLCILDNIVALRPALKKHDDKMVDLRAKKVLLAEEADKFKHGKILPTMLGASGVPVPASKVSGLARDAAGAMQFAIIARQFNIPVKATSTVDIIANVNKTLEDRLAQAEKDAAKDRQAYKALNYEGMIVYMFVSWLSGFLRRCRLDLGHIGRTARHELRGSLGGSLQEVCDNLVRDPHRRTYETIRIDGVPEAIWSLKSMLWCFIDEFNEYYRPIERDGLYPV